MNIYIRFYHHSYQHSFSREELEKPRTKATFEEAQRWILRAYEDVGRWCELHEFFDRIRRDIRGIKPEQLWETITPEQIETIKNRWKERDAVMQARGEALRNRHCPETMEECKALLAERRAAKTKKRNGA